MVWINACLQKAVVSSLWRVSASLTASLATAKSTFFVRERETFEEKLLLVPHEVLTNWEHSIKRSIKSSLLDRNYCTLGNFMLDLSKMLKNRNYGPPTMNVSVMVIHRN